MANHRRNDVLVPPAEEDLSQRREEAETKALFDKNEQTIDELQVKKAEDDGLAPANMGFEVTGRQYKTGEEFEIGQQLQDKQMLDEDEIHVSLKVDVDATVRKQVALLGTQLREELTSLASAHQNGISARMLGGEFDCPKCGQRLISPARTAQSKGLYEHPFTGFVDSGKKECEFKGVKFKSPVLFLEFANPRPLTPKQ